MTTREVVLDANVIVGLLDPADALHLGSQDLLDEIKRMGKEPVLLDFIVEEALSVLCRRAHERRRAPPEVRAVVAVVQTWHSRGWIRTSGALLASRFEEVLEIVAEAEGVLNVNDAKLVRLQRGDWIGQIASFDRKLTSQPGLNCFGV